MLPLIFFINIIIYLYICFSWFFKIIIIIISCCFLPFTTAL